MVTLPVICQLYSSSRAEERGHVNALVQSRNKTIKPTSMQQAKSGLKKTKLMPQNALC
jgi:hypothetical protein